MAGREVKPAPEEGLALRTLFTKPGSFVASSLRSRAISRLCREPAVPIRFLLEYHDAFTPEDVKILVDAYEDTLRALKLTDRKDPRAIAVAKLIIEFAKGSERDLALLRDLAMKTLRDRPRPKSRASRRSLGRRKFLATLGGVAAAWPLAARAQQPAMPVVGLLHPGLPEAFAKFVAAFRQGLGETSYVEGHCCPKPMRQHIRS
jgi:hypothetical protein